MIKRFRAWDGKEYWYSTDDLLFVNNSLGVELRTAEFELKDLDQFIGKNDCKGRMIYENDLLINSQQDSSKTFQVIWSSDECGFRKVPHGMPMPETKIDEAFMEIIGTINSHK